MSRPHSAAVIGGGWAGCAAAATLAGAGVHVTLFEAAADLGGRGRRLDLELDGVSHTLDNGQHLMLGAYTEIARLLVTVGVELDAVIERRPFEIAYPDGFRLRAAALPAPLHLAAALVGARGLSWRERGALLGFLQALKAQRWIVGADLAAAQWLAQHGQSPRTIARLWRPLGIAALNTPLERASARIFAAVLRDSLGAAGSASMLWLPRADLSALLPEAVERFLAARGSAVRRGARVEAVVRTGAGFEVHGAATTAVDAVVYAAPPAQLARIAAALAPHLAGPLAAVARFDYEPIATVYLKYAPDVRVPRGFAALLDDPAQRAYGQWVFDRGPLDSANRGVLAVVVSASGPHDDEPLPALCAAVATQLSRALGLPPPRAARAIVEKRATLAAVPGLQRPSNATALPGFVLAGDWTDSEYPSTLESAVRSGVAAARLLLA